MPTPTDDNNAWERQGRKDGAYPPLSHAPLEPRRNERSLGNLLPGPSGWSPRRRSYLSFHDCAAWSSASGWMSSRYGRSADFSSSASPCRRKNAMVLLEPPPYRVPQPSRPGQPAALLLPLAAGSDPVSPALCAGLPAWKIHRSQSHRKKAPYGCFLSVDPAATYLPMPSPAQYFRRIRA